MKKRFNKYSFFTILLIILAVSLIYPSFSQAVNLDLVGYVGGQFNDFQVVGNYAYIATENGLTILDISIPASPQLAGNLYIADPIKKIAINLTKEGRVRETNKDNNIIISPLIK